MCDGGDLRRGPLQRMKIGTRRIQLLIGLVAKVMTGTPIMIMVHVEMIGTTTIGMLIITTGTTTGTTTGMITGLVVVRVARVPETLTKTVIMIDLTTETGTDLMTEVMTEDMTEDMAEDMTGITTSTTEATKARPVKVENEAPGLQTRWMANRAIGEAKVQKGRK
jgi:hypothetical protein